jgi:hypothetical protein
MSYNRYDPSLEKRVHKLALLGATERDMAFTLNVPMSTFDSWKRDRPSFNQAIQTGRMEADSKVAAALYRRACGYSHPDEQIFIYRGEVIRVACTRHIPPDTTAALKWLTNRQREIWTDVSKLDITHNINVQAIDLSDYSTEELLVMEKMGMKALAAPSQPVPGSQQVGINKEASTDLRIIRRASNE